MERVLIFNEVLEAVDSLTLEEQEALVDILHKRVIERRRGEIARDVEESLREYDEGRCRSGTPAEIMREIRS